MDEKEVKPRLIKVVKHTEAAYQDARGCVGIGRYGD